MTYLKIVIAVIVISGGASLVSAAKAFADAREMELVQLTKQMR